MAHTDSDGDAPNPSNSFNAGAADRLSGFFTPVWESKRRRAESERGSNRPPSSKPGGAPPSARGAATAAGSLGTDSSRPAPPPARKSEPPRPQGKVADKAEPAATTQLTGIEPRIAEPVVTGTAAERRSEPPGGKVTNGVAAPAATATELPAAGVTREPVAANATVAALGAAPNAEQGVVTPEPATRLRADAPAHPVGEEPLRPRPRNDSPVPEARRIAVPVVLRDTLASNATASVPSSAFSVHQDIPASEWDSPDMSLKPFAKGEGPTPEAQLSHLLRRLRRTIPLYASLPDRIKKLIEDDGSSSK